MTPALSQRSQVFRDNPDKTPGPEPQEEAGRQLVVNFLMLTPRSGDFVISVESSHICRSESAGRPFAHAETLFSTGLAETGRKDEQRSHQNSFFSTVFASQRCKRSFSSSGEVKAKNPGSSGRRTGAVFTKQPHLHAARAEAGEGGVISLVAHPPQLPFINYLISE